MNKTFQQWKEEPELSGLDNIHLVLFVLRDNTTELFQLYLLQATWKKCLQFIFDKGEAPQSITLSLYLMLKLFTPTNLYIKVEGQNKKICHEKNRVRHTEAGEKIVEQIFHFPVVIRLFTKNIENVTSIPISNIPQ